MAQLRNWCFTLNNYSVEEVEQLENWDTPKYIVWGYEESKEGTPHLQGYVEFKQGIRITALKKFNRRIHWESRKGTQKGAISYCKKDGKVYERGQSSEQGRRTDLENVYNDILKKKNS